MYMATGRQLSDIPNHDEGYPFWGLLDTRELNIPQRKGFPVRRAFFHANG